MSFKDWHNAGPKGGCPMSVSETIFDVAIVGAGPSGSTCAYYLAQQGHRVLVLEKKKFPRDKLCGDAVCTRAHRHMRVMGVMQEIEAENKGNWAKIGGFVGPSGESYIGDSTQASTNSEPLVIAIKRIVLDEKMAKAAVRAGADLRENTRVSSVDLDRSRGVWSIHADNEAGSRFTMHARLLVLADGALSRLATQLGLVSTPPDGICSRSYIKAGTHRFNADGVVFYTNRLLPGYAALFKEAGGDVNYCCYIIPGGKVTNDDLHEMHHELLETHPYIKNALGPNVEMEKMRGAPLRLGGIPKSYDDNLVIIGDAAGHIDPMTGEGIHFAMDAGHLAAVTLGESLAAGNLSASFLKRYQDRWMKSFGNDFFWSKQIVRFYARHPQLLDVYVGLARRHGQEFLADWAKIMTGDQPKHHFLKPRLALPLLLETGRVLLSHTLSPKARSMA
jgi:geranylgeranyl reductase family protein